MTHKTWQIPRRSFLKGLGTAIALPALDAMLPGIARAAEASSSVATPRRLAFVYIPNGVNMTEWTPKTTGADFDLPSTLEPLQPHKRDLMVLTNLAQDKAFPNGDGPGDHARASATFLTGCQARKTQGADIRVGVSVDQMAAATVGRQTRFASLELGCDRGQQTGNCDSGYSCAYSFNISWKTPATPMPPETNPRQVFERLFGGFDTNETAEARAKRERYQKSILDFVLEDARRLKASLGATDQRKLDEYLTAVRELEQRIERTEKFAVTAPELKNLPSHLNKYDGQQHIRLMYDLMALAFQTDTTRVATFIVAHDGSNKPYPFVGAPEGHHDLSHHGGSKEKLAKIAKINAYHITQFAYFLEKLKSIKEGDGTLLDNSMIVYGGGIGDGNAHNHDRLPVLLAGRGGGTINPGRHLHLEKTPMTNLYRSLLERAGAPVPRIGDSTGLLADLS